MSTALKQYLHEHAQKHHEGQAMVAEWRSAVERLFGNMREWLKESDSDSVMQIEQTEQDVNEPGIGRYRMPRLNIGLLGQWIEVIPRARIVRGFTRPPEVAETESARGRVDITDMVRKYFLYRFGEGDKDEWFIEGPSGDPTASVFARPLPKPLNKEAFETALMRCLR